MEIKINDSKIDRIKKILTHSEFKSVEDFTDHALDLLLFAEENKDKFRDLVSNS